MFKTLILKYLLSETGKRVIIELFDILKAKRDNTVDENLSKAVDKALCNKDYGLQRKPTGPRKPKTAQNAKTKTA